jgi:hypothetical protein
VLRIARKPSSSRPGLADNIRVVRPWGRWKRRLVAERLLHMALLEIRFLAANPSDADHPDGSLAQIRMIADICHRLPVSPLGRDKEGFDPFVYMWQTASPDQQRWLTQQLQAIGVDQRYLEESPPWPRPATPPAVRPRWERHGWQLPRDPRAFKALDTTTLRALILEADALEPPGRKHPNWLLAHLHPDGPHILRASRTDEILFLPQRPADLRQYRCLVWMEDSTTVVGHVRLRASSFTALPANLSRLRRMELAAIPPRRSDRDVYLWGRDHRAVEPDCQRCTTPPATEPMG